MRTNITRLSTEELILITFVSGESPVLGSHPHLSPLQYMAQRQIEDAGLYSTIVADAPHLLTIRIASFCNELLTMQFDISSAEGIAAFQAACAMQVAVSHIYPWEQYEMGVIIVL